MSRFKEFVARGNVMGIAVGVLIGGALGKVTNSLVAADLGVALGTGTDVAKEAGDVVLVKPELAQVVEALRLSRDVLKTIRQNMAWAFSYNLLMVPLAALAPLPPAIAALAMSLSSVTVVANSLRLCWKWR